MFETEVGIWIDTKSPHWSKSMLQFSITPNFSDGDRPFSKEVRDLFFKLYQNGTLFYSDYTSARGVETIIKLLIGGKR